MSHPIDRHLPFSHRFKQRALRPRGRSIDLIGQQHIGEDRPGTEFKLPRLGIENRKSGDVAGKQIRGTLDAAEPSADGGGEGFCKRGFSKPRKIIKENVPSRQHTGQEMLHHLRFAQQHSVQLGAQSVQ